MTGEVASLARARKARDKAAREVQAAANRAAHGRTKAQRAADAAAQDTRTRLLDGARLNDREGSPDRR